MQSASERCSEELSKIICKIFSEYEKSKKKHENYNISKYLDERIKVYINDNRKDLTEIMQNEGQYEFKKMLRDKVANFITKHRELNVVIFNTAFKDDVFEIISEENLGDKAGSKKSDKDIPDILPGSSPVSDLSTIEEESVASQQKEKKLTRK